MDPVTHLAVGALSAQFSRRWIPDSKALWPFCLIASVLPDIDHLSSAWSGPEAYLLDHRGMTHSIFGAAAMALLLAAAFRLMSRKMPLKVTLPVAAFILGAHIFLDLATSYGTQLLAPISDARFSMDAVFIIDPFFTGTLLVFILLARLAGPRGFMFAAAGLVWVFAYPLTNLSVHDALEAAANQRAQKDNPAASVEVLPAPFAPIYWKAVTDNGTDYQATTINLLNTGKRYDVETLPKAGDVLMSILGRSDPFFNTYAWFARFPYVVRTPDGDGEVLEFGDLRFLPVSPILKALRPSPPDMFTVTAVVDQDGNLKRRIYQGVAHEPNPAGDIEPAAP